MSSHKGAQCVTRPPGRNIPAYVLPDLMRHPPLSLGVLSGAGLLAYLDSDKIELHNKNNLVSSGVRDETTDEL
jgi:hypothetical protein